MRRQQTNPINTTTTTTTTTSDNLATELRQIQNMSRDDFVGREQLTVHHNRNDENNNNRTPNTETVDPTSTIPPDRPSNQYMTEEQIRDMVNYYYSRNPTSTRPRMNIATMHTQPLTPPPTSPVQDEIEVLLEEAAQTNQNIAHNFMQNHDAFRHIGDNIRTLRQQVLTIIDSLTGWSMNHPYLIMGTLATVGGTLFFAIRGYRAIILTGAFQQITPNVGGVLSTIFNRENTPENTVNRRHFFNVINTAAQTGGIIFIMTVIIRGLRRL